MGWRDILPQTNYESKIKQDDEETTYKLINNEGMWNQGRRYIWTNQILVEQVTPIIREVNCGIYNSRLL